MKIGVGKMLWRNKVKVRNNEWKGCKERTIKVTVRERNENTADGRRDTKDEWRLA